jgi:hypothetical protein
MSDEGMIFCDELERTGEKSDFTYATCYIIVLLDGVRKDINFTS